MNIIDIKALQTEKETLEQTINRLVAEEQNKISIANQTLAQKAGLYQELLKTGVRNESNWREPIRKPIIEPIGALAGLVAGMSLGYYAGVIVLGESSIILCPMLGGMSGAGLGAIVASERQQKITGALATQRQILDLAAQEPALLQQKSQAEAKIAALNNLYNELDTQTPRFRVKYEHVPLVKGTYSKINVSVENAGNGPANQLALTMSGQFDGKAEVTLGDLLPGKSLEAQLPIKPTEVGQMEWQTELRMLDVLGRPRTLKQTYWVEVAEPLKPATVAVGGDYMPGGQKVQTGDASVVRIHKP